MKGAALHQEIPLLTPGRVTAAAGCAAVLCGMLTAIRPALGIAFVLVLAFVPVAFLDLRLALVLWTPIPFIRFLPAVSIGPAFLSLVVLVAWIGTVLRRDGLRTGRHPAVSRSLTLLLFWLTMSIGWGAASGVALNLLYWYVAALVLAVLATTLRGERDVRLAVGAFVVGAVLSVTIGLLSTGFHPADSALESATFTEGRLQGASGDPNYLAAGLVPAALLAGGLAAATRSFLTRMALVPAAALIAIGLAASQSRGGLIAALVAAPLSVMVLPRQRVAVVTSITVVAAFMGVWFLGSPTAWERVTQLDGGGDGRADLWQVAWRVSEEHPLYGVGLGGFPAEAQHFVRRPGELRFVQLIVDQPHVAHNTYLQLLAETGIVGLVLFLAVCATCLMSTYRAGTRLKARGPPGLAVLARTLFIAQVAALVALLFITNGTDVRLWVLFALGLVMNAAAREVTPDDSPAPG
jgi:O-antigen ligase